MSDCVDAGGLDRVKTRRSSHPIAELFPMLGDSDESYQHLRASISVNGQMQPIVVDAMGSVLDGRRRLRACQELGIKPRFVEFSSLALEVPKSEYAFAANFSRRNLTSDQRVQVLAAYEAYVPLPTGVKSVPSDGHDIDSAQGVETNTFREGTLTAVARKNSAELDRHVRRGKTRDRLAQRAKVSTDKARQAIKLQKADPILAKQVVNGHMTLAEAEKIVDAATPSPAAKNPDAQSRLMALDMTGVMQLLRDMINLHAINDAARINHVARELAARADFLRDRIGESVRSLEALGRLDPRPRPSETSEPC